MTWSRTSSAVGIEAELLQHHAADAVRQCADVLYLDVARIEHVAAVVDAAPAEAPRCVGKGPSASRGAAALGLGVLALSLTPASALGAGHLSSACHNVHYRHSAQRHKILGRL
jgi:hypothetical protein